MKACFGRTARSSSGLHVRDPARSRRSANGRSPPNVTCPTRPVTSALRRLQPSGVRKQRSYADRVANGSNRPKGGVRRQQGNAANRLRDRSPERHGRAQRLYEARRELKSDLAVNPKITIKRFRAAAERQRRLSRAARAHHRRYAARRRAGGMSATLLVTTFVGRRLGCHLTTVAKSRYRTDCPDPTLCGKH
jgi:hypothetical protein